jgi:tetratricopeptide (TPR) repeat protein
LLALRSALAREPGNRELRRELARHYLAQDRFKETLVLLEEGAGADPLTDADRHLLAWALVGEGRLEEARACLRGHAEPAQRCVELALMIGRRGRWELAAALLEDARALQPGDPDAWLRLSMALTYGHRFQEAEAVAREAIGRLEPSNPGWSRLCFHLGSLHLLQGWFETGLPLLEARFPMMGLASGCDLPQGLWPAGAVAGRTVLLGREQGMGDVFMTIRFARTLEAMGARVLLEAPPGTAALLATCPGVAGVVAPGATLPPGTLRVPLMSLPLGLGVRADTIPAPVPYLQVPREVRNREAIAGALAGLPGRILGLVWAGEPTHARDAERSLAPEILDLLGSLEGYSWVSLQKGGGPRPALPLVDLGPLLSDYGDTAYALSRLDGLISVDTSVVHLAGALGRPVWTLVANIPDWRWMLERTDSPWYPAMELWRQPAPGDWSAVLTALVERLRLQGFP